MVGGRGLAIYFLPFEEYDYLIIGDPINLDVLAFLLFCRVVMDHGEGGGDGWHVSHYSIHKVLQHHTIFQS